MNEWSPLKLSGDEPLNESGRERFSDYRLDPVIDTLYDSLSDWLGTSAEERTTPPRIGVFGGLGQGKSTVIRCTLEKLDSERKWLDTFTSWLFGPRIAQFDVSYFKATDLEWRFLTAVLWRRIIGNFLPVVVLVALEVAVLLVLMTWYVRWAAPECSLGWFQSLRCILDLLYSPWTALLVPLSLILPKIKKVFKPVEKTFSQSPAKDLYLSARDLTIQKLAVFMLALPDIVVIDDLDRATVEQQRAFLRSISRFSRELGFAVVVCMDESELLAAPPNPEAPEELLRKTLNAELRIPDRTREDVILLAMACIREFVRENSEHPLSPALRSVQFVGDLTRVLLLGQTPSAVSPRLVHRILARVVLHASQLNLSGVDDLSALLRLDGLLQMAPMLRRHMDELRRIFEANRVELLVSLLTQANVAPDRLPLIENYFSRTRMMQPSLHDGWFRLLGGLKAPNKSPNPTPWSAQWEIVTRTHEFFRLFHEAIELDAAGYRHDLELQLELDNVTGNTRYEFVLPGGTKVFFQLDELPPGFRNIPGDEYLGMCWVIWVSAMATTPSDKKLALFERACLWTKRSGDYGIQLSELFWRECLADNDLWRCDNTQQSGVLKKWWERVHNDNPRPKMEHTLSNPMHTRNFTDAWKVLVRSVKESRDGRKTLHWWRGITPEIDASRLQPTNDLNLVSNIWPPPVPESQDAEGWFNALALHIQAHNALNSVKGQNLIDRQIQFDPATLLYAWRRAQLFLNIGQCLDILYRLACDDKASSGERWSMSAIESWLVVLDESHQRALKKVVELPPQAEYGECKGSQRRLALIFIAALQDWTPGDVASLIRGLPRKELQELQTYLTDRSRCPAWLCV